MVRLKGAGREIFGRRIIRNAGRKGIENMRFDVRRFEGLILHSGSNKINELVVSWYCGWV